MKKRKQKMENNTVAWLALIVAIFGGLPGLINIGKLFKEPPKFFASVDAYMTADMDAEEAEAILLMPLTITNLGKEPLMPRAYFFYVKNGDQWLTLEKRLVPNKFDVVAGKKLLFDDDPSKLDLQKMFEPLVFGAPRRGYLFFSTKAISAAQLREILNRPKMAKLICQDVLGKKYEVSLSARTNSIPSGAVLPAYGIRVSDGQ